MKGLFLLMVSLCFGITMYAQNTQTDAERERENKMIEAFLPTLDARRSEFVGQPAKKLFDVIRGSAFWDSVRPAGPAWMEAIIRKCLDAKVKDVSWEHFYIPERTTSSEK